MKVLITQLCRLFVTPWTVVHQVLLSMEFSGQGYWIGQPFSSPGNLPNPGIKSRSPTLQANSLPAEPQGKPKNIGVGSLFLLQQISPTQELDPGLLHCRQILYQLSYEGSPFTNMWNLKRKSNSNKQRAECWCYQGQKRGRDGVIKGYVWGCSYIEWVRLESLRLYSYYI